MGNSGAGIPGTDKQICGALLYGGPKRSESSNDHKSLSETSPVSLGQVLIIANGTKLVPRSR